MFNPIDSNKLLDGYNEYLKEVRPYYTVKTNDKNQDVIDRLRRGHAFILRNIRRPQVCINVNYEEVILYFTYEYAYIASTIQKNRYESQEAYFNEVEVQVLDQLYAYNLIRF